MLLIKRVVIGAFILYGYNLIAINFNMVIPINVYSLSFICLFGSPALFALVLFRLLVL